MSYVDSTALPTRQRAIVGDAGAGMGVGLASARLAPQA
ncbi:hypothetical protein RCH05_001184 [Janthinobacterium sp. CAN_S7]